MNRLLVIIFCLCSIASIASAQPAIVINEAIYDATGTDVDTWLELKGPGGMSLDNYRVIGINQAGVPYNPIALTGFSIPADGYFLITQDPSRPDSDMSTSAVDLQNGPGDNVQLQFDTGGGNWVVMDAVGYETDNTAIFNGEGTWCAGQTPPNSMARCPDGFDSQDNSADFIVDPNPTPGYANAGTCAAPGACCFNDGTCQVTTQVGCQGLGGTFQGENTSCDPNPCEVTGPIDLTLCEVAADSANGLPLYNGMWVRTRGVAYTNSNQWQTTNIEFQITDGQCCVTVFKAGATTPFVAIGDEVEVVGTVGMYGGKTEIHDPDLTITVLSSGNPIPAPAVITTGELAANGEQYESCFIKIECVNLVAGTWPAAGSNANLTIDDGTGPVTMRIDKETDIDGTAAPTGPFTVQGMSGQFTSSPPYADGYQILPRFYSDLSFDCQAMMGACCYLDGSCAVITQTECLGGGGTYQGDNTACDPNPCDQVIPTDRTLCEIAADDADGIPVLNGEWVHVTGIALTRSNQWQSSNIEFNITDGECCVTIFQSGTTTPYVEIGDEIDIIGTVGYYNGKTEIMPPNFTISIVSSGNPLPEPASITTAELAANGEPYEACYFKIPCVTIVGGTWPAAGSDANITIDDGSGSTIMRIDRDTDIDGSPVPTEAFTVYGIGTQFDSSIPYTSGYQIMPRFLTDLVFDCAPAAGACCFTDGSCIVLDQSQCLQQGGSYLGDGTVCEPNDCPQPAMACCFDDGHCEFLTAADCTNMGGAPQGFGTVCEPNDCPQPAMACCFEDGHCEFILAAQCTELGGAPQGYGTDCDPNDCPQPPATGACCLDDQGHCELLTQAACAEANGVYQGDGTTCEPNNPCPIIPTKSTSWGQIKATYR